MMCLCRPSLNLILWKKCRWTRVVLWLTSKAYLSFFLSLVREIKEVNIDILSNIAYNVTQVPTIFKSMAPTSMRSRHLLLRTWPGIILSLEPTLPSQALLCLPGLPLPMPPRNLTLTHEASLDRLTPNGQRRPTRAALFRSGIGGASSIVVLGRTTSRVHFPLLF